jgi:SAM-dependent methyltransferase
VSSWLLLTPPAVRLFPAAKTAHARHGLGYVAAVAAAVKAKIHDVLRDSRIEPARVLEVGGVAGRKSLLDSPQVAFAERVVLNLAPIREAEGIEFVLGNANDMPFEDDSFDLIMSSATLEHDKRFWLSLGEMKRVLRPGGLLIISVPGFVKDPERDRGRWTRTYRVHFAFDYYRFSEQAVREVFFEGMERVKVDPILRPPRIVGHGYKPAQ